MNTKVRQSSINLIFTSTMHNMNHVILTPSICVDDKAFSIPTCAHSTVLYNSTDTWPGSDFIFYLLIAKILIRKK